MNIATESVRADLDTEKRIFDTLSQRLGPQKFNAWFKHGTQIQLADSTVKLTVPNPFVANWVDNHYREDIRLAAMELAGRELDVTVNVDSSLSGDLRKRQLDQQADIVHKTTEGRARRRQTAPKSPLRHQLGEFVVGESNRLAYSAAQSIITGSAPFNLLFIHGCCGVGKTHLLQGICNALNGSTRYGKPVQWKYVTGEQFTNEFVSALRQKRLGEFRNRYRKLDLLAIDDVHFLSAKRATQDEFLHTFNAIEAAGKTIVMASDAHPRMLGDLNEQLQSRFVSGMTVKVDSPDCLTRMEVLKRKAAQMNLDLDPEVLRYVGTHIRGSVRELEGTLMKLSALSALENGPVTVHLASSALSDHLARVDSAVTLGDIESVVAAYFGITPADIHSSRRTRTVSVARMVSMFLARRHTRMSYPEIGKFMGKNHSSVVLAVQRMDKALAAGDELKWMTPMGPKSMPAQQLLDLLNEQVM
ncbi:MAG: chromosomal replication initiator protein DnaA [Phycisphaerae bacterium]